MGIRILHAADVHLGREFKGLGDRAAERRRDLEATFSRICDEAINRRVAALLISGDLFDSYNPPDDLVGLVQGRVKAVGDAGIPVFIIPGNHDEYSYRDSVWQRHQFPGAHVFTEPAFTTATFQAGGTPIHIHGLAYNHIACRDPLPTLARSADGLHIAMLHATVDVPDYQQVEQRYLPLTSADLRALNLDYVALGHIHRTHVYAGQGVAYACYPGSPEGLTMREVGDRHVALVELGDGAPKIEWLRVNGKTVRREMIAVDNMSGEEMAATIGKLAAPDLLLTAILTGAPRDVVPTASLLSRLGHEFFWLDLEDETALVDSRRIEEIAGENTIRGFFVQRMRERILAAHNAREREMLELALKLGFLELEKRSLA